MLLESVDFNTTLVTINLMETEHWYQGDLISIQHLLLLIGFYPRRYRENGQFQYNTCYY